MLENGHGTAKNPAEAKIWYERAAALEYPPALNDLGRLYLTGTGVPKSYALAKSSFEQAAKLGDAKAMNNLGMLYLNGTAVQRDIDLGRTWLEKAAALGDADAQANLRHLQESPPLDGAQVTARRESCLRTCGTLHRSYVNSVCNRYSAMADGDKPDRTKCVSMSLTAAQQCRGSCRDWAHTSLADNGCVTCFQMLTACSVSQTQTDSQGNDMPYEESSKRCLAALAGCTANCRKQMAQPSGTPGADGERPN